MTDIFSKSDWLVTRRELLEASGLLFAGLAVGARLARGGKAGPETILRFGIVTDPHYADIEPRGARHYRESVPKMTECIRLMNEEKVDFLVELGDFKDENRPPSEKTTLKYLETIEGVFGQFKGPRYHVLGNHDVDSISKTQFSARVTNTGIPKKTTHYSFDSQGVHFVVLDANYTSKGADYDHGNFDWRDTNIPTGQLHWLRKDLDATTCPVIVFVHQQLDGEGPHTVNNAPQVREILEESRRVFTVFQGHNHPGAYSRVKDIHYYTLRALVDGSGEASSAYAIVDVRNDHSVIVTGYRRAAGKTMAGLRTRTAGD